jgi:serine-type D-Ala-D-Ala carboxypeptidase/endopeptidase
MPHAGHHVAMHLRVRAAAVAAAFCAVSFTSLPARAAGAETNDVQATLQAYAAAHLHAALIAGVIDGERTQIEQAAGTQAPVARVDERTHFQIGSVTKVFTATLLAEMVLAHEVSLDDPIQKYLPNGIAAPSYHGTRITLGSLAEQRSGLPRLPPNLVVRNATNPYAGYTSADLYDGVRHTVLTRAPGAQYEYSNFGYMLLGQLLANRAHTTYAALVRTRIFKPLHMDDSVVTGTPANRANLIPGFATDGTRQPRWDFGDLGGLGAIESDLHDMLIFAQANLAAPAGPLGAAIALAQRPREATDPASPLRIGLGWMTNPATGIAVHNGETGGYHAVILFSHARHRAVVVLANVADMSIDTLALHLLVPALVPAPSYPPADGEPSPVRRRLSVVVRLRDHGVQARRPTVRARHRTRRAQLDAGLRAHLRRAGRRCADHVRRRPERRCHRADPAPERNRPARGQVAVATAPRLFLAFVVRNFVGPHDPPFRH